MVLILRNNSQVLSRLYTFRLNLPSNLILFLTICTFPWNEDRDNFLEGYVGELGPDKRGRISDALWAYIFRDRELRQKIS